MAFYCSEYCKYESVCDKNNRSFKLQSTIRAIELYNIKGENIDYLDKPYRSYQLSHMVGSTIEKEKSNANKQ